MTTPDVLTILGVEEAIKACFEIVFKDTIDELSATAETWLQQSKLLTTGRNNFAHYVANTVGIFPLFGTSRFASVSSVYVDVSITNDIENEKYRTPEEIEKNLRKQKQGDMALRGLQFSPLSAIEKSDDGFALLGNAGTGKSTVFRYLTVEAAKGTPIRGKKRIPIYLAVRDMALSHKKIMSAAIQLLEWLDITNAEQVMHNLLKSGNCIILVDGLDETDSEFQRELIMELSELRAKYQKSVFCISARKHSLSIGLTGFQKWETQPLSPEARKLFVEKWFQSVDTGKGKRLLDQSINRPELLDLGSSPLLLSIVCALYNNDLDIPSDPDELYSRCAEGLLGAWDIFRNIARDSIIANFSIRKRIILISWIAYTMFEQEKIVFSETDVSQSKCLEKAAATMRQAAPAADELLKALQNDFGILVERAPSLYSFSHLTLQEYLTALYIVDNRKELSLITVHFHHRQWSEIIFLVAKMLPNADEYLKAVTKKMDLSSRLDTILLKRLWNTKPILSTQVTRELMYQLANQIAHALKVVFRDYRISNSVLFVDGRSFGGEVRKQLTELSQNFHWRHRSNNINIAEDDMEETLSEKETEVETAYISHATKSQKEKKKNKSNQFKKTHDYQYVYLILNIPVFLEIIHTSGLTYEEIGCEKIPFFYLLQKSGTNKIVDIVIE
ncbi:MAG: NACHT domain-containing protein [Anaerolineales bacterium]